MPESHKAERRRVQKANRAAGIGDEMGRIPVRVKVAPTMLKCTMCRTEFKVTKTNTEQKAHASSKHGAGNYEECFPGAEKLREELLAGSGKGRSGSSGKAVETKAERKKKTENAMDDLLSAGLSGGPGKKKGKK